MKKFYKEEKGFALALVLLITTLVVITVLEFNYEMRVDASIAFNYRDDLKALYIARGGINAAIAYLREDFTTDKINYEGKQIDYPGEYWAQAEQFPLQFGNGVVTVNIIDECGKINLNEYLKESYEEDNGNAGGKNNGGGKNNKETKEEQKLNVIKKFFDYLPVTNNNTDEIIESLLDWVGESSEDIPSIEAYYNSFNYESKIGPFDDISELLLLKGMSKNVFYQEKEKNAYEETTENDSQTENTAKPLTGVLTTYSNKNGKININTAPKEVILALHEDMDEETASEIIDTRIGDPFKSAEDLKKVSDKLDSIVKGDDTHRGIGELITFNSSYFRIIAHGTINDVTKTIEVVVHRDPAQNGQTAICSWEEH